MEPDVVRRRSTASGTPGGRRPSRESTSRPGAAASQLKINAWSIQRGDQRIAGTAADGAALCGTPSMASRCASLNSWTSATTTAGGASRFFPALRVLARLARVRNSLAGAAARRCRPTPPVYVSAATHREPSFGFVNSVTTPFCRGCNRLRLSADGRLFTCLFAEGRARSRARCCAHGPRRRRLLAETIRAIWRRP